MFEHVRIVMVDTSHPGNIGAAARAMKNMGLSRLYLVNPKIFPDKRAIIRAAGADEILQKATVTHSLEEAIADCSLVCGTSARTRTLPWPLLTPRQMAERLLPEKQEIALVFGRESRGLSNEELSLCHFHVHIPTEESFSSLNLGAAIQVLCYEMRMAALGEITYETRDSPLSTVSELAGLQTHLAETLRNLGFLNTDHPMKLLHRLRRLFNKAQLEKNEVNILRGILSSVDKHLK